ncbi:hypothetical protein [Marininema halotolerans]|nr:hypothetical protein [Marininema halotolerans]
MKMVSEVVHTVPTYLWALLLFVVVGGVIVSQLSIRRRSAEVNELQRAFDEPYTPLGEKKKPSLDD